MLTQCQPSHRPFIRTFVIHSLRVLVVFLVALVGLAWLAAPAARADDPAPYRLVRTLGVNNTIFSQHVLPDIAIKPITIRAGQVDSGSRNHLLGGVSLAVSTADASLTGLTVPLTGTYTTTDVGVLKLWDSSDATFDAEQDTLLSTLTTPGAAGDKLFPAFIPI